MVGEKNMASSSGWAVRSSADRVVSGSEKEKSGGGGGVRRRARRRDKERRTKVLRNEDGMINRMRSRYGLVWTPTIISRSSASSVSNLRFAFHLYSGDCICRSLTFEHLQTHSYLPASE